MSRPITHRCRHCRRLCRQHHGQHIGHDDIALRRHGGQIAQRIGHIGLVHRRMFTRRAYGDGIVVIARNIGKTKPGGGDRENARAAADIQHTARQVPLRQFIQHLHAGLRGGMQSRTEAQPRIHHQHLLIRRGGIGLPGWPHHETRRDAYGMEEALPGLRPRLRRTHLDGRLQLQTTGYARAPQCRLGIGGIRPGLQEELDAARAAIPILPDRGRDLLLGQKGGNRLGTLARHFGGDREQRTRRLVVGRGGWG